MELRPSSPSRAVEELGERMTTRESSAMEAEPTARLTLLSASRVVRIVPIVESCTELGVGKDFIGFVHGGHLGLGSALIRVCDLRGVAANDGGQHTATDGMAKG
jgi:hypothetical protein